MIQKINEVIQFAYGNPHSSFYRMKYGQDIPKVSKLEDIAQIPFLTREEIARTPFWERVFYPPASIQNIRVTSGTSGRGVLLMPRQEPSFYGPSSGVMQGAGHIKELGMRRTLTTTGAYFQYERSYRDAFSIQMLGADLRSNAMTGRLARLFCIDSLAGFPYALTELASTLAGEGIAENITAIELFGEKMSAKQKRRLTESYKNARFFSGYASIEAQSVIAQPCAQSLMNGGEDVHAVLDYFFIEIIDEGTSVMNEGDEGEIVITSLRPLAFPLIRYRTGDRARVISSSCPCKANTPRFSILGRFDADRLRVAGGEINLAEATRALHALGLTVSSTELVYRDEGVPRIEWRIHLLHKATESEVVLAERLMKELHLAPGVSYESLVKEGIYAPLTVRFLDAPGKSKIVRG